MSQLTEGSEWLIRLSAWVVQDGNYSDFVVGERRRFAVAFADLGLAPARSPLRSATPRGNAQYEISAELVFRSRQVALIDFGLLAYIEGPIPRARVGSWLAGPVALEVDPFSYFEIHAKRRGVPPAVYTWTITGIWIDQTNAVERTDAWTDYGGYAVYTLRCLLGAEDAVFHP